MPNHTDFGEYWNIMWKGLEACWTGQKSPGDAVSEVEAELKNSLGSSIIIK
jgi:inositol-phosphate transport system substrate-binding protein